MVERSLRRRALIDSTVLMAACISATGASRRLLEAAFTGRFEAYFSLLIFLETERNLTDKKPSALPQFGRYRREALNISDPALDLVQRVAQVIVVKDAPIVAAAVHANAAYLVTLDRVHLLSKAEVIRAEFGIDVITPGEALTVLL